MLETIITIIIVYLVYFFVSVMRFDKTGHAKKNKSKEKESDYYLLPAEVKYFIKKYNVDTDKINYRGLLKLCGLVLGIDIAIVSIIVLLIFESVTLQVLVGILAIIPVYLISIKFVGIYFKKKGLTKNV